MKRNEMGNLYFAKRNGKSVLCETKWDETEQNWKPELCEMDDLSTLRNGLESETSRQGGDHRKS